MGQRLDNALYLEAIRDGNAAAAIGKYSGSRYIEHSTPVKDGQASCPKIVLLDRFETEVLCVPRGGLGSIRNADVHVIKSAHLGLGGAVTSGI